MQKDQLNQVDEEADVDEVHTNAVVGSDVAAVVDSEEELAEMQVDN